jgi:uncharacterized membrane protein YdjX (TVP38/TMEM64 family)
MKTSTWIRVLAGVLAAGALVFALRALPVRDWTVDLLSWIQGLGPAAPVILVAIYIVACVLLVPGSLITLGAGFLFGLGKGFVVVSVGSVAGATVAFLVGRTVAREWISRKVLQNAKFRAVDEAVGRRGFYIVLLTRLSPVFPFTLLNYFYGITAVRTRDYVLGSWIGMIPGTLMYVYFGSLVKNLTELAAGAPARDGGTTVFFWLGLVATIAVAVVVTRIARRALDEVIADDALPLAHPGREGSSA